MVDIVVGYLPLFEDCTKPSCRNRTWYDAAGNRRKWPDCKTPYLYGIRDDDDFSVVYMCANGMIRRFAII